MSATTTELRRHRLLSWITCSGSAGDVVGLVGVGLLLLVAGPALLAPLIAPYNPSIVVTAPFAEPSLAHLLGANDIGQDLLSELIYGARISLLIGVLATLIATTVGTTVGLVYGVILVHAGNDLLASVDRDSTAGRIAPQLIRWMLAESAQLARQEAQV